MQNNQPSQEILDCLSNEMNVNLNQFLAKYNSFENHFKIKANELLTQMLTDSRKPIQLDAEVHYKRIGQILTSHIKSLQYLLMARFRISAKTEKRTMVVRNLSRYATF